MLASPLPPHNNNRNLLFHHINLAICHTPNLHLPLAAYRIISNNQMFPSDMRHRFHPTNGFTSNCRSTQALAKRMPGLKGDKINSLSMVGRGYLLYGYWWVHGHYFIDDFCDQVFEKEVAYKYYHRVI